MHCAVGEDDPKGAADAQLQLRTWHLPTSPCTRKLPAGWPLGISRIDRQRVELVMSLATSGQRRESVVLTLWGSAMSWRRTQSMAARAFQAAIDLDPDTESHYFRLAHLSPGKAWPDPLPRR